MIDGLVVVDKPAAWTSHDVVARCRKIFGQKRVGHSGTLDPDATGVLLVGLGRVTRLLRYLTALPKSYAGEVVLGTTTTTLDAGGDVIERFDMGAVGLDDVRAAAGSFVGDIEQIPPMVSAVKVDGRRLHEMARAGEEIERAPRPVTVHRLVVSPTNEAGVFAIDVDCSSGTYIRTLAADIGTALGGGAHLRNLRRTAIGSFLVAEAIPLEDITPEHVLAPADALRDYPSAVVDDADVVSVGHGRPIAARFEGAWRVLDDAGDLLAVYEGGQASVVIRPRVRVASNVMEVITDPASCPALPGSVVTIGAYDGVHLGHRALIADVRRLAAERGCASAVVTFDRHPAMVVRPESAPKLLTDLEQKLELLADTGVDHALVIHFDEERAAESAPDFVKEILVDCLHARSVVVGHDFHFGRNRAGNVPLLMEMGAQHGFDVLGIKLVEDHGAPVSSTEIRRRLAEGDIEGAAQLLGRPHEVRGVVVEGDRRGRELGFPTANVALPAEIQLPADGIYAGWYERADGSIHPAALSLGRRPTFYDDAGSSLLEAYLIDFDGDLYGERARIRFVKRLRGEQKFDSIDALTTQIAEDVEATRRSLEL